MRSRVGLAAATALLTAGCGQAASPSTEVAPGAPGPENLRPYPKYGVISEEQAQRPGVDGSRYCLEPALLDAAPEAASPEDVELLAGYVTDTDGFVLWQDEFSGMTTGRYGYGPGLVVICWFKGDVATDESGGVGPVDPEYLLTATQLTGEPGGRLDMRSATAIPVMAAPEPVDEAVQDAVEAAPRTTYKQPDGVVIGGG